MDVTDYSSGRWILVNEKWHKSWQYELAAKKANCTPGIIKKNMAESPLRKVILPFYSTLMRTHQEYCTQVYVLSVIKMWTCYGGSRGGPQKGS